MEGYNQPVPPMPPVQEAPAPVGFPGGVHSANSPEPKKSRGIFKWIIALIVIAVIIFGGIYLLKNNPFGGSDSGASPTPETLSSFATPKSTPTPTPTSTPEASPKPKSEVKIEILNGTGKAGEASYLKEKLEGIGYSDIEAANSDTQDEVRTTFSFDKDLSDEYVAEITKELESIYTDVRVRRSSLDEFDVSILTGPRKSAETTTDETEATASPSPTASPEASE